MRGKNIRYLKIKKIVSPENFFFDELILPSSQIDVARFWRTSYDGRILFSNGKMVIILPFFGNYCRKGS